MRGTWWVVAEGPYKGRRAYVNAYGVLMIFSDVGDYDTLLPNDDWPLMRKDAFNVK